MLLSNGTMPTLAADTFTTAHSPAPTGFDSLLSSDDLIQGMIALENPGDTGWHPANTNPADQLVIFTDGLGGIRNLSGLLNDFPGAGNPTKVIQYDFDSPVDIGRINILTGNRLDSDGRIFSTTVINYSTDEINFPQLGYFQSDPSGTINNPGVQDPQAATFVSIFDDASATLLSGVTNLEFLFYSVDNTGGQMRDPYDGVNPFTGFDDTLSAAIASPLVWEIDVLAPVEGLDGDYNGDGKVDAADYVVWRKNDGSQPGYDAWRANFGSMLFGSGGGSATSVPEPHTFVMLAAAAGMVLARRRRLILRVV
jgi:hypothetical protein